MALLGLLLCKVLQFTFVQICGMSLKIYCVDFNFKCGIKACVFMILVHTAFLVFYTMRLPMQLLLPTLLKLQSVIEAEECQTCSPRIEAMKASVDEDWDEMSTDHLKATCTCFWRPIESRPLSRLIEVNLKICLLHDLKMHSYKVSVRYAILVMK